MSSNPFIVTRKVVWLFDLR